MALKDTWTDKTTDDYITPKTVNELAHSIMEIEKNGAGAIPTISVEEVLDGYEFTINDGKGNTQSVVIKNGQNGEPGESGMPTEDSVEASVFVDPIPSNTMFNVSFGVKSGASLDEIVLILDFGIDDGSVKQWGLNFTTSPNGFTFRIQDIGGLELKWATADPIFEPGKSYMTMFTKVDKYLIGTWAVVAE